MTPVPWKLWEGHVVDLCFPLREYLGGTDQSAVFLTQYNDPEPHDAAIKLLVASPQDAELVAQWDRAAQLSHPNLLRVLRRGSCQINQQSLHYIVTEYAEEDLAAVLAERSLSAVEVREMLEPLLEALVYIHSEGLVHGRLKPANIMAAGDQLKLSVDRIATVAELSLAPSIPGPYDPPEFQERGGSPIGDVWSFGMILVEALTRELPQLSAPKQDPVLPGTIPAEFLPMVRACLRVDPRRRSSIRGILAQFRNGGEPEARTATPPSTRRWLNLGLVSAGALALVVLLGLPRGSHERSVIPTITPSTVAASPVRETAKPEMDPLVEPATSAPKTERVTPPTVPAVKAPAPEPVHNPPVRRPVEAQPGDVVRQVMPDISDPALKSIRGKVKISVLASVDSSGHVTAAKVQSQNSRYFANLAVRAVEQWAFAPKEGSWVLRFEFTSKGSDVRASRTQ